MEIVDAEGSNFTIDLAGMKNTIQLEARVYPEGVSQTVSWSSGSVSTASVDENGLVTAKKKGTVKITVYTLPTSTYKSAKKTIKITIN